MPLVNNKRWKVWDENHPESSYVCATKEEAEKVAEAILSIYRTNEVKLKIDTIFPLSEGSIQQIIKNTDYTEKDASILLDMYDKDLNAISANTYEIKTYGANSWSSVLQAVDSINAKIEKIKRNIKNLNVFVNLSNSGIVLSDREKESPLSLTNKED